MKKMKKKDLIEKVTIALDQLIVLKAIIAFKDSSFIDDTITIYSSLLSSLNAEENSIDLQVAIPLFEDKLDKSNQLFRRYNLKNTLLA